MKLAKVGAVLLLLQRITPALVYGVWRPGGLFLLAVAAVYALLGWGVWASKQWALILALILTAPQLVIVSTKLFSWQFYIGGAFGPGLAFSSSLLDTRFTVFASVGARFDCAVSERCSSLLASYPFIVSDTFVLLNAGALLIFTILVAALFRCPRVLPSAGGI